MDLIKGPANYKRIVVKIGSNVLTRSNGLLDQKRINHLAGQVSGLIDQQIEIILVSSGAVASGKEIIDISSKADPVIKRQVLASIGQVKLITTWTKCFRRMNKVCAQILVTKEDFRDRKHYLNMKNCLSGLLQNKVIPIINENDVVAVTELMFTDNDELAGLVAAMMNADALMILSNIDGIYDGDPKADTSRIIPEIFPHELNYGKFISSSKSAFGRGGMLTKYQIAQKTARLGINVHIANGRTDHVLSRLAGSDHPNTHFKPSKGVSARKKWIAFADQLASGQVTINNGACQALYGDRACSLLPIGIIRIDHPFQKGDIVRIATEDQGLIGYGIAEYGSETAVEIAGQKGQRILIHYNYLHLN